MQTAKLNAACETSVSTSWQALAHYEREARELLFWQGAAAALEAASRHADEHGLLLNDCADIYDHACAQVERLQERTPTLATIAGGPNE